ncbi:hypothetical protein [Pseudoalteromonas rubra]|uniref:hypothetical protein n=1 Tax=Pseudoalteromonas rubra TaxID=43658 RepID=UPI000F777FAC|nr:hypothetical protein [Pseudoalteromonas rubra]
MTEETELLVQAIKSLQSNALKDYLFPSSVALISGGIGVWAASFSVSKQEKSRIEIDKIMK